MGGGAEQCLAEGMSPAWRGPTCQMCSLGGGGVPFQDVSHPFTLPQRKRRLDSRENLLSAAEASSSFLEL